MATLVEDKELIAKASQGDSESLSHLAIRAYWDYKTAAGASLNSDVELLMDAAGVCENGKNADKTADFYKYELNPEKAEKFYAYGAINSLDGAAKGDANACMELAKKYAYGKGLEQSDEKACFWTQAAADAGSADGLAMMKNFWQSDTALPVSSEMASKQDKVYPAASDEVKALKKALVENEAAKTHKEAAEKSKSLIKQYHFTDLRKTAIAHLINPITTLLFNLVLIAAFVYIGGSILVFIVNFFAGYHESGFIHYVNEAFNHLLGIPLKFFLTIITDLKFGEITTEVLCENYSMNSLLVAPFKFIISGAIAAVWLALSAGVFCLLGGILGEIYRQGIKIEPDSTSAKSPECPYSDTAYNNTVASNPELAKYSTYDLMAISSIAQCNGISINEACRRFEAMRNAKEEITEMPVLKVSDRYSGLSMYFVLNSVLHIPYAKMPNYYFPLDSDLMRGYVKYRAGKNYTDAERKLQYIIDSEKNTAEEKAWAKYFISLMCNDVFLCYTEKNKADDEKVFERGIKLREEAAKDCVFANSADMEAVGARLWYFDHEILTVMSTLASSPELSDFFTTMASMEMHRRYTLGEPMGHEKWEDYETDCLAAKLNNLTKEYNKLVDRFYNPSLSYNSCRDIEKELKALKGKIKDITDKKYMRATVLLNTTKDMIKEVSEQVGVLAGAELAKDRQRQLREEAINRKLSEFDARADSVERDINMFISGNYSTNSDMFVMGKISNYDMYLADDIRRSQREKLRKELEQEM